VASFILTSEELSKLKLAHRSERNKRSAYRINAIILLGQGWKIIDVKDALLIDDETLRGYVEKYKTGGISALLETHYSGRVSLLSEHQLDTLREELDSSIYLTTQSVIAYVVNTFGVNYSQSGMRDMLHRIDYVFKKPKLIPGNPDRDAQEEFAHHYYAYMDNKPMDEAVLFVDAVHPEHNAMAAYGWIKKGCVRHLKTNSGRQRLNLHGALNIETMEITVIESDTIDADSTIDLLVHVTEKYKDSKRIHVILDNARYHYSKKVKEYLEKNKKINLVFLPPYSPELNLIERVWKYFKKNILYNKYYENLKEFRSASENFFRGISNHKNALTRLLGGGFEGFDNALF
jgi:transposase